MRKEAGLSFSASGPGWQVSKDPKPKTLNHVNFRFKGLWWSLGNVREYVIGTTTGTHIETAG